MYYYIYDSFTHDPKYAKEINKISLKLTDLDILGEEARVTPLRKIDNLVEEAIKRNYKNIIAVGDDETAYNVIQSIARRNKDVCFGMISLRESIIAKALGIPQGEEACDIISARRRERIDLGKINNHYFLTSVKIGMGKNFIQASIFKIKKLRYIFQRNYPEIKLKFEEGFTVTSKFLMLSLLNILSTKKGKLVIATPRQKVKLRVNPRDGLLDVVIVGAQNRLELLKNINRIAKQDFENISNLSFFRTKKVKIISKSPVIGMVDSQPIKVSSLAVEVLPKKLSVIVGKEREF